MNIELLSFIFAFAIYVGIGAGMFLGYKNFIIGRKTKRYLKFMEKNKGKKIHIETWDKDGIPKLITVNGDKVFFK